jgi:hypothetical protein
MGTTVGTPKAELAKWKEQAAAAEEATDRMAHCENDPKAS